MSFEVVFFVGQHQNFENSPVTLTDSNLRELKKYCGYTWRNLSLAKKASLTIMLPLIMMVGITISLVCKDLERSINNPFKDTSSCNSATSHAGILFAIFGSVGTMGLIALQVSSSEQNSALPIA